MYMSHIVAAPRDCHTQKHPVQLNDKLASMEAGQVKNSVHHIIYTRSHIEFKALVRHRSTVATNGN